MVNFVVPRDFGGGLDLLAKAKFLSPRPRQRPQNFALRPRPRPRINITGQSTLLTKSPKRGDLRLKLEEKLAPDFDSRFGEIEATACVQ